MHAVAMKPYAAHRTRTIAKLIGDAEIAQHPYGARTQILSAGFYSRKEASVYDADAQMRAREQQSSSRTCGTAAGHQGIKHHTLRVTLKRECFLKDYFLKYSALTSR